MEALWSWHSCSRMRSEHWLLACLPELQLPQQMIGVHEGVTRGLLTFLALSRCPLRTLWLDWTHLQFQANLSRSQHMEKVVEMCPSADWWRARAHKHMKRSWVSLKCPETMLIFGLLLVVLIKRKALSVFAGCYGVDGESDSIMSSTSENSTEPWFCDACKNGVTPSCELCPNQDGIFKETDAGRWVTVTHWPRRQPEELREEQATPQLMTLAAWYAEANTSSMLHALCAGRRRKLDWKADRERERIHRAMRERDGGKSRDRGREGMREKSVLCEAWRLQPRYRW